MIAIVGLVSFTVIMLAFLALVAYSEALTLDAKAIENGLIQELVQAPDGGCVLIWTKLTQRNS